MTEEGANGMILLLDNYDSFVHNVARYLRELGARVEVVRSDAVTVEAALERPFSALVLSPGPGGPEEAGIGVALVRRLGGRVPVLGICLGHQVVAQAYGGRVVRGAGPMHGRGDRILHRGDALFQGVPSPFTAGRYHSLVVDPSTLPPALRVVARTRAGEIMAVRHVRDPVWGVQFHPESVLTPHGRRLLGNFLGICREARLARPPGPTAAAGASRGG